MASTMECDSSIAAIDGPEACQHDCDSDSVCSTLSESSLIECRRNFQRQPRRRSRRQRRPQPPSTSPQSRVSPPLPPPPLPISTPLRATSPALPLPPPPSDCLDVLDGSVADFELGGDDIDENFTEDRDALSSSSGGSSLSQLSEDRATFRSTVMRQFEADLDRLEQTVAQRVAAASGGCGDDGSRAAPAACGNVYSVVKSGCLSLLLSRVLPPILERFEQRMFSSLLSAGLLGAGPAQPPRPNPNLRTPEICKQQQQRQQSGAAIRSHNAYPAQKQRPPPPPPPPPQPPPKPAPRLRKSNAELHAHPAASCLLSQPVRNQSAPLLQQHQQLQQPCSLQQRVSSPYFHAQTAQRHFQQVPLTVRNNSSLTKASSPPPPPVKATPPPLPPKPSPKPVPKLQPPPPAPTAESSAKASAIQQRQQPPRSHSTTAVTSAAATAVTSAATAATTAGTSAATSSTAAACSLVHAFTVRDSPSLREILDDPGDRKVKSISQRYGCYIGVFQRCRRPGHAPFHRVVVRAPGEKALRMCLNALDSGLGWDLGSQLGRKSVGNPAAGFASSTASFSSSLAK